MISYSLPLSQLTCSAKCGFRPERCPYVQINIPPVLPSSCEVALKGWIQLYNEACTNRYKMLNTFHIILYISISYTYTVPYTDKAKLQNYNFYYCSLLLYIWKMAFSHHETLLFWFCDKFLYIKNSGSVLALSVTTFDLPHGMTQGCKAKGLPRAVTEVVSRSPATRLTLPRDRFNRYKRLCDCRAPYPAAVIIHSSYHLPHTFWVVKYSRTQKPDLKSLPPSAGVVGERL